MYKPLFAIIYITKKIKDLKMRNKDNRKITQSKKSYNRKKLAKISY